MCVHAFEEYHQIFNTESAFRKKTKTNKKKHTESLGQKDLVKKLII